MAFFKKKVTENSVYTGKPEFIIAGLGNPGKEYEYSRHNAGFLCLDILCNKYSVTTDRVKYRALTCTALIEGHPCLIMRPQTYMNSSGEAIKAAADFYKIPSEKIIVIYDDISLPTGTLRIRKKGSAGGHNGIKSIISHIGQDFPRIKMGVGQKPHPDYDLADWVLGKFTDSDKKLLADRFEDAHKAVKLMVKGDSQKAMNLYNR